MSDGQPGPASPAPGERTNAHSWPDRPLTDDEVVAAVCRDCHAAWRVHHSLAGCKLRCHCGAWVEVPSTAAAAKATEPAAIARPTSLAIAPAPPPPTAVVDSLRQAGAQHRAHWSTRTLLEFAAMLLALVGPQLVTLLLTDQQHSEQLLPWTTGISFALVAIVAAGSGTPRQFGFRSAPVPQFLTAAVAAGAAVAAAWLWLLALRALFPELALDETAAMTRRLGVATMLFVVAFGPAVLEEVVFRGLLQGRLMALLGARVGLVVTAATFAICHAQPAVLPIHFGLGLALGWLRERSGSLLPGMLMHFGYNAAIVLIGIG